MSANKQSHLPTHNEESNLAQHEAKHDAELKSATNQVFVSPSDKANYPDQCHSQRLQRCQPHSLEIASQLSVIGDELCLKYSQANVFRVLMRWLEGL